MRNDLKEIAIAKLSDNIEEKKQKATEIVEKYISGEKQIIETKIFALLNELETIESENYNLSDPESIWWEDRNMLAYWGLIPSKWLGDGFMFPNAHNLVVVENRKIIERL